MMLRMLLIMLLLHAGNMMIVHVTIEYTILLYFRRGRRISIRDLMSLVLVGVILVLPRVKSPGSSYTLVNIH